MPPAPTALPRRSRRLLALRILIALVFAAAGIAKIAGVPELVAAFEKVGLGQWFRYFTGLLEVSGAVLLVTRRWPVGAAVLNLVATGAVVAHLVRLGGTAVPAAVLWLGTGALLLLWARAKGLRGSRTPV